jgi:uncharacterized protein (DUF2267 family)
VRGLYYDQWRLGREPERYRSLDEFLARIDHSLSGMRPVNRTKAAEVVFSVLGRHLTLGQFDKVRETLPEDIRTLSNRDVPWLA